MTPDEFGRLVTDTVRRYLPDVRATRRGAEIVWTLGAKTARLDCSKPSIWWLHAGCLTYDERRNAASAHVAASNIVTHFDLAYCQGIDVRPYSATEMARIIEHKPLRSQLGA